MSPEGRGQFNHPFSPESPVSGAAQAVSKFLEESPSDSDLTAHSEWVKLRSKPIRMDRFTYPSGREGFLVVGTVTPGQKPWREKFQNEADARERQEEWENDRLRVARGMRLRATSLSTERLADAESAWRVAQKLGYESLLDVVLALKTETPDGNQGHQPAASKTYKELHDLFVPNHREHSSKSHSDKIRQESTRFGEYIGWATPAAKITPKQIHDWVSNESAGNKKTFNHKLNNLGVGLRADAGFFEEESGI